MDNLFKSTEPHKKSAFEKIAEKTTPLERFEMLQLGLNPFSQSDINQFNEIKSENYKIGFYSRLVAAWKFLWTGVVNSDLELVIIKKINAAAKKINSEGFVLNECGLEGLTRHAKKTAEFVDRMVKVEPSCHVTDYSTYTEDLSKIVKARAEAELNKKEEPISGEAAETEETLSAPIENITPAKEGFIPERIPVVFDVAPEPSKTLKKEVAKVKAIVKKAKAAEPRKFGKKKPTKLKKTK
jgi:hypothetical protein